MRISDWSSDVCSSDLRFVPDIQEVVMPEPIHGSCLCGQICFVVDGKFGPAGQCHCSKCRKVSGTDGNAVFYTDRKNDVWGKSVFVSVDLGVRRMIKKKKNNKEYT